MHPARLALFACVVAACESTPTAPPADAASDIAADVTDAAAAPDATLAADVLRPPVIARTASEAALAARRRSCSFRAGAWPAETVGVEHPVGADIPINHVIVIMQENRSFDHYLGRLTAQGYYRAGDFTRGPDGGVGSGFARSDELDTPPPGWSNPDSDGTPVVPHPDDAYCYGVNHSWRDMHDDYNGGRLDHFVTNNNPGGHRAMFYEDDTVIPFYYALADTFAIGDQYHASVMSSTWPNRYFLMAATSFGIGDNSFCRLDTREHPVNHIFAELEAAGRTWKDYTDGPHQVSFFLSWGLQRRQTQVQNYRNVRCDLMTDIANNTLPDVSFVMGDEVNATGDEGPSNLPGIGGQWVEGVVRALMASPAWRDTAVFITYDENGGLADHVPPEPACPPDGIAAHDENGNRLDGDFTQTGFRVPFILVSPYARRHFVSHQVYDHTSITRFIEARFGLPAMSGRDANATVPYEMFDFASPPFMTPPTISAHTTVPDAVLNRCNQHYVRLGCSDD
jgi:phospholipase C